MRKKEADYVFHPPTGSSVPGKEDANPFMNYPPEELRKLIKTEQDAENLRKMKSALKQWERIYTYPYYPYRKSVSASLRVLAKMMLGEVNFPAQNVFYYQDSETPEGFESIMDSGFLQNVHDNDNAIRFDYNRQGERPEYDVPFFDGDFTSKSDGVFDPKAVKPRGDGPDPEGLEVPFPPTGGPIDQWPDML